MTTLQNNNRYRWGIIYCPRQGAVRPMRRWREIREYLGECSVEYDFFLSENGESVEHKAKMLADNDYETIVVVGGDGAIQDAINGVMASEKRDKVSLGLIPNGIANDFARFWNMQNMDVKEAVDCIMGHRVRAVDVGCCSYIVDGVEQKRYFLNVLNIGLGAIVVEIANRKHYMFARALAFFKGLVQLFFYRQNFSMRFKLNNTLVEQKFMMLSIGNARGYGMTPSAVPYNGMLDVTAMRKPKFLGVFQGLYMLVRRKILNFKLVEPFRTKEIIIDSVGGSRVGIDGRPFYPSYPLRVSVESEGVKFIIPGRAIKKK